MMYVFTNIFLLFFSWNYINYEAENLMRDEIPVEVTFGRGVGCTGRGICSLTTSDLESSLAMLTIENNQPLWLKLNKADFSTSAIDDQIEDDRWQVPENYSFDLQDHSITIPEGHFEIMENETSLLILF